MKLFAVVPALLILVSLCGSPVPPPPGSVSGSVFYDTNLNGVHDLCDRPLAGAEVVVVDSKGKTETATTGPSGDFTVANVAAGNATVSLGRSLTQIWPSTTAGPSGLAVNIPSSGVAGGIEIGAASSKALSRNGVSVVGVVFSDKDGDGKAGSDECGIPQSRIEWLQPPESNPEQSNSAQSSGPDPNGDFVFSGLKAVPHLVISVVIGNWSYTGPGDDPCTGRWPGIVPTQRSDGVYTAAIPLKPEPRTGVVSGVVFEDKNGNGLRDTDEPGVPGVRVSAAPKEHCFDAASDVTSSTDGAYAINGLGPAKYDLAVTSPGQAPSNQFVVQLGGPVPVDLSNGPATVDLPARLSQAAIVHVRVYSDTNGNGVRDAGEGATTAQVCLYPAVSGPGGIGAIQGGYQGCTGTGIADDPAIGPLRQGHYAVQVTTEGGPSPVYGPSFVDVTSAKDVTLEIGIVPSNPSR